MLLEFAFNTLITMMTLATLFIPSVVPAHLLMHFH